MNPRDSPAAFSSYRSPRASSKSYASPCVPGRACHEPRGFWTDPATGFPFGRFPCNLVEWAKARFHTKPRRSRTQTSMQHALKSMYVYLYIYEAPYPVNEVSLKSTEGRHSWNIPLVSFKTPPAPISPVTHRPMRKPSIVFFAIAPCISLRNARGPLAGHPAASKIAQPCRFPHRPENYDAVIARLSAAIRDRAAKRALRRTLKRSFNKKPPPNGIPYISPHTTPPTQRKRKEGSDRPRE